MKLLQLCSMGPPGGPGPAYSGVSQSSFPGGMCAVCFLCAEPDGYRVPGAHYSGAEGVFLASETRNVASSSVAKLLSQG